MKLFNLIKNFRNDEDGAVTVDWVVLTAAIVGLAVAVLASIKEETSALGTKIADQIKATEVGASGTGTGSGDGTGDGTGTDG